MAFWVEGSATTEGAKVSGTSRSGTRPRGRLVTGNAVGSVTIDTSGGLEPSGKGRQHFSQLDAPGGAGVPQLGQLRIVTDSQSLSDS